MNHRLADKMGVPMHVRDQIESLQEDRRESLEKFKDLIPDTLEFDLMLEHIRKVTDELQALWGFEVDRSKQGEYLYPHCTCPVLDNKDIGEHFYINMSCPLHGDKK